MCLHLCARGSQAHPESAMQWFTSISARLTLSIVNTLDLQAILYS